jgi:hypothetical protein
VEADALDGIGQKAGVKRICSPSFHHPRTVDPGERIGGEAFRTRGSARV